MNGKGIEESWHSHSLDTMVKYWLKGYELPKGMRLYNYEWWVDGGKGFLIIKLYLEPEETLQ